MRRPFGPFLLRLWALPVTAAGYGFGRYQRFVGTTVFHWFTSTEGNVQGPWQPVGGRASWDGSVAFWRAQIRDMMLANIDAVYLHLIAGYEEIRITFFQAFAEMRAEGWDVPKIAPFLDPFGIWREAPIDLAHEEGKDAFVSHYVRFYEQYFACNKDPAAASYLLTVDNKLALTTWWVSLLPNAALMTRDDVEKRLRTALASRIPQLAAGIWMITTALIDPDLNFSDERMVMFSGYTYALHSVHNGIGRMARAAGLLGPEHPDARLSPARATAAGTIAVPGKRLCRTCPMSAAFTLKAGTSTTKGLASTRPILPALSSIGLCIRRRMNSLKGMIPTSTC